ncbi:MAG: MFS transporter [Deferrisomatales bacterium]|nr:MFS transporter [Deferrisomatales bacterium]
MRSTLPHSVSARRRSLSYAYVITGACFSIQAIGIGCYISFGVFFNPIIAEFGWSRAMLSGAQSLAFLLMGFLGIFVGRLNDKVGPRRMMAVTGVFFGLGYLLMSRVGAVWQLYLFYSLVFGIGLSAVDVIPLSTTARWFVRRRGIMTGIVKVGTGAGQLTVPLVASLLITHYGWRTAYTILGVGALLLLVSIGQLLRRDPAEMGLPGDADTPAVGNRPRPLALGLSADRALRTRQFWTLCGVCLASVYCLLTVMVHIVPHARDFMASPAAAGVLATIGGVSMAGRFGVGMVIDRIGSKRSMLLSFGLLTISLLWLQAAREAWMLYAFALMYGVAHGGFFTSLSPIVAEHFGLRAHGTLFGMVTFCGNVGGAVGPFLAGYIFDVTGAYRLAFWTCVGMSVLGLALLASVKPISDSEMENNRGVGDRPTACE